MADIGTLVEDIYQLFKEPHECSEEAATELGQAIAEAISLRLNEKRDEPRTLRMSNLGRGDRQIWYEIHSKNIPKEELQPETKIKFLFGDILELMLLFLSREAGHDVSAEQAEVEVDGVKGHIDAIIDGHVVDVKSASSYSFKKFKSGDLRENDPFGYYDQLAGYSEGLGNIPGGWLAIDKQLGKITFLPADVDTLKSLNIPERIRHLKGVITETTPPARCYEAEPEGLSGNLKLGVNCSYCPFKQHCWQDANDGVGIRTFLYANKPIDLVHVEREPNVMEVTFNER